MTDHNDERTFAALPPAQGRSFAQTWWGQAWLKALEDTALDSQQVKAGRRLARAGAVGAVSVRPGRITAVVLDRDRTAHRADVLLQELSPEQWERGGTHLGRGRLTLCEWAGRLANHDDNHLDQLRRAVDGRP